MLKHPKDTVIPTQASYILCTTPRSGSSLLCNLLTGTKLAGRPSEYFFHKDFPLYFKHFEVDSFATYLPALLAKTTTENGMFGVKAMAPHFFSFVERVRALPQYQGQEISTAELVAQLFPNVKYIWLTRRDRVRQAVSQLKAMQTGIWHSHNQRPENWQEQLHYSFADITNNIRRMALQDATWQIFFTEAGIEPLTIIYEDFLLDREGTLRHVFEFIGASIPANWNLDEIKTVQKLTDQISEQWVAWYLEEKRHVPVEVDPPAKKAISFHRQATLFQKPADDKLAIIQALTADDMAQYVPIRKILASITRKLAKKSGFR